MLVSLEYTAVVSLSKLRKLSIETKMSTAAVSTVEIFPVENFKEVTENLKTLTLDNLVPHEKVSARRSSFNKLENVFPRL